MKIEITNWRDLHSKTKQKLFKLMRQHNSVMRAAIDYHDHHDSHMDNSTAIGRNANGRIIGWAYACPFQGRGMYVMTYVDHDFRRKGYGTKIVRELLSAHQAAHGPKKFHACCIETKFFVGCGIKHMTAMIPVKLSWKENLRKSNEQSTQKAV